MNNIKGEIIRNMDRYRYRYNRGTSELWYSSYEAFQRRKKK